MQVDVEVWISHNMLRGCSEHRGAHLLRSYLAAYTSFSFRAR